MVGQTTAKKPASNSQELIDMFNKYRLEARQKKNDAEEKIAQLSLDARAFEREEFSWETAIYELESMLEQQTNSKRRGRKHSQQEEEEEEEREEVERD